MTTDEKHPQIPKKIVLLPKKKRPRLGQPVTHPYPRPERPLSERPHPERPRPERPLSERPHLERPRPERPLSERPHLERPRPERRLATPSPRRTLSLRRRSDAPNTPPQYQQQFSSQPIRLNKYIANTGAGSRREADEYIRSGAIQVNGVVVTELGTKISRQDTVLFHGRLLRGEAKVYIVLNKPKNCVTTTDDPQARMTVSKLVRSACREHVYPVGRLDRNTTGVILLTNDGDLASKLLHPTYKKKKIYHVWLDKPVTPEDVQKIVSGIELEDGEIHADDIRFPDDTDKSQIGIELHSGRNHLVRRIFRALGYNVTKLDRVYFAGLTKKNLGRGKWRFLNDREVNALRTGMFE
jgi:23S rRNA pseudouridine2605 synthase